MPLDTSIENVGEYYSSHYLDSTFTKDTKQLLKGWRQTGADAVPRRLQRLGRAFFRAKEQALEIDEPRRRLKTSREALSSWHGLFLEALGYTHLEREDFAVDGGARFVPVLGRLERFGQPWLAVCETGFCLPDGSLPDGVPSENPFDLKPLRCQLIEPEQTLFGNDWGRACARVLTTEDAPRWLLLLAGSRVCLLDRNTYAQGRYLAFDLDDAYGRRERGTFEHFAAFLAAETLCADASEVLHDKIEEQSHRFAHGVTDELQLAVREAIELLANEWVDDRRRRNLAMFKRLESEVLPDGRTAITAEDLRRESLVFVYRLIFCFYAEAHGGELGILPIDDDVYRLGYSLEALRDLEQVPLTPATEAGTYFHEHLRRLFGLIQRGFQPVVPVDGLSVGVALGHIELDRLKRVLPVLEGRQQTVELFVHLERARCAVRRRRGRLQRPSRRAGPGA